MLPTYVTISIYWIQSFIWVRLLRQSKPERRLAGWLARVHDTTGLK